MTRNPIKRQRKGHEFLQMEKELYPNRQPLEIGGGSIKDRSFQVDSIYVKVKQRKEAHPYATHEQKRKNRIKDHHGFGESLMIGWNKIQNEKADKQRAKIRETPLTPSEKVYWARIVKNDQIIVKEMRDMKFHVIHSSLSKLHHKILEQQATRQYSYRDFFFWLDQQMKQIHARRY